MATRVPISFDPGPDLAHRLQLDVALVDRLVAVGLMDPLPVPARRDAYRWASFQIQDRLDRLGDDPLELERLGIRPLDILCCESRCAVDASDALAVTFCDLEGFTRFTRDFGNEAARYLLAEYYESVRRLVERRDGSVEKKIGDGHMLSFPTAASAVLASLDIVASTLPLRVRAGVHFGAVLQLDDDLLGDSVNIAARITALAAGGTVLASVEARDAAGDLDGVRYGEPVRARVRGLEDPLEVCEVSAA